jgi:hypothetical protein
MATFRIQVSETHNKEFVVDCIDRNAAETVAAGIMVGTPAAPADFTRPPRLTSSLKTSHCAIAQELDSAYDEAVQQALDHN